MNVLLLAKNTTAARRWQMRLVVSSSALRAAAAAGSTTNSSSIRASSASSRWYGSSCSTVMGGSTTASMMSVGVSGQRPQLQPYPPQQQRRHLHLTPREVDHLQLHQAGRVAQYRLARGIRLNHPEAVALICLQMLEAVREGTHSVAQLMQLGKTLLGTANVMDGVPSMLDAVQLEATFPDGTKLLTVHAPIAQEYGDLQAALKGSFLPVPDQSLFAATAEKSTSSGPFDSVLTSSAPSLIPGQVLTLPDNDNGIPLNAHAQGLYIELSVTNTGDRPIQVGSHYAFVETNKALQFDRRQAIGKRLNIPAGASVRFEPGESKAVTLTPMGGRQNVVTGNRLTDGSTDVACHEEIMQRVVDRGFRHQPETPTRSGQAYVMDRSAYADMYGPTVGDKVRLGDTTLEIRVERDYTVYGDECKFGGGKTIREGMGQMTGITSDLALDTVITNCLIVDACLGIVKADVGIKGNSIVGIGKAGNPDMMEGVVDANMIVGNS